MLKDIRIKGTFGHPNSYFEFKEGLTSITGRNGRGKSMIQEMVQFALWGIAALRGVSSDYPELRVALRAWIKDKPYSIDRTISKATLYEGHDEDRKQIATGTKAVNIAIKELFGYSMAVFQVANAVNQKKVDEFCQMLPTARKRLVDETIGLSALDELTKWMSDTELGIRSAINARADIMIEPVPPQKPEGYTPVIELERDLAPLLEQQKAKMRLEVTASQTVVYPVTVNLESDDGSYDALKAQAEAHKELVTEARLMKKEGDALPAVPPHREMELEEDDDKLEEYRAQCVKRATIERELEVLKIQWRKIPKAHYTVEQLLEMEKQHDIITKWHQRAKLIAAGIDYHCEKCSHDGVMVDPRVHSEEFAGVPELLPEPPTLTMQQVAGARLIAEAQPRRDELVRQIEALEISLIGFPDNAKRVGIIEATRREVTAAAYAKTVKARHDEMANKLADLGKRLMACPDTSADVARIEQKRAANAIFTVKAQAALELEGKIKEAQAKLAEFRPDLDALVLEMNTARTTGLIYETQMQSWNLADLEFKRNAAELRELTMQMENWFMAKQAVNDLRTKIKGFLLPSLNKVASYLVNEFSAGELPWLVVNDAFEVIVNGQRVETLSGGQKTIANLAIRIGLGQVLTNRVFPVLMLDEPDESCDDIVAAMIERTLGVLKGQMKQILLVTHKTGASADHNIHMG